MKKLFVILLMLGLTVSIYADVEITRSKEQVDKKDSNSVIVTIPITQKETITYEDLLSRKVNLEKNLVKLEDEIKVFEKYKTETRNTIQENIKLYDGLIAKAAELGVKEKEK